MARYGYSPIYYDQPAALQLSNTNNLLYDEGDYPDPYGMWYEPDPLPGTYGYAGSQQLTALDYQQPGKLPDFVYVKPDSVPAPAPEPTPTPPEVPIDSRALIDWQRRYEESRRYDQQRQMAQMLQIPQRRAGGIMDEYQKRLVLRELAMRQRAEDITLKQKLMRDYIDRMLRTQGAPI